MGLPGLPQPETRAATNLGPTDSDLLVVSGKPPCPCTSVFTAVMWAQSPHQEPPVATARVEGDKAGEQCHESVVHGPTQSSFMSWADSPTPLLHRSFCALTAEPRHTPKGLTQAGSWKPRSKERKRMPWRPVAEPAAWRPLLPASCSCSPLWSVWKFPLHWLLGQQPCWPWENITRCSKSVDKQQDKAH